MAYIGNQPVLQTTEFREEFAITTNTTTITTLGYSPTAVEVFRNGVLLGKDDYTLDADGVNILLATTAISGDTIVVTGRRSLAQGVSISESRVEYTWQASDTFVQLNTDVIPAYTDVYVNGVKLASDDYSINVGLKQVSFTVDPADGDVVAVVHKNETSALVALPLKDSYGNEVLSQSGNAVSIGTVRLPTSGGIQDSAGNNVLSESGGTVTLTANEVNVGSNALVVNSSGIITMPNQPAFLAKAATSYTGNGTTGGYELFEYTDVELNVGSHYDPTSTECKFTAPISGNYLFSWWASASTSDLNSRYIRLQLYKNGSVYLNPHNSISNETGNADYNLVGGTAVVPLLINETVQVWWGSNIATDNITFYSDMNFFSGYLIG